MHEVSNNNCRTHTLDLCMQKTGPSRYFAQVKNLLAPLEFSGLTASAVRQDDYCTVRISKVISPPAMSAQYLNEQNCLAQIEAENVQTRATTTQTESEMTYYEGNVALTADSVAALAGEIERIYVAVTLESLLPRMALVGWTLNLKHGHSTYQEYQIMYANDLRRMTTFNATYAEIMQIRRMLDEAEVRYLIEANTPLLLQTGFQFREDEDWYSFISPDGVFQVVTARDVDGAHALINSAKSKLNFKKTAHEVG